MAVALAVVLVFTVVALVMWRLAERTARTEGRRVGRLQRRVREQREEITALSTDNAALIRQLAKYRLAAGLLVAAADPDPLEALYALPAYNPEEHR